MATTPLVKQGEIEITTGRAKSTSTSWKVSGQITDAEGKVKLAFPGGVITAKDGRQACMYALAHIRYLGLHVVAGTKLAFRQL